MMIKTATNAVTEPMRVFKSCQFPAASSFRFMLLPSIVMKEKRWVVGRPLRWQQNAFRMTPNEEGKRSSIEAKRDRNNGHNNNEKEGGNGKCEWEKETVHILSAQNTEESVKATGMRTSPRCVQTKEGKQSEKKSIIITRFFVQQRRRQRP